MNRLNEIVPLSTQITCLKLMGKEIIAILGAQNILIWTYDMYQLFPDEEST